MRELLEDSPTLTSATNLCQILPFILHDEMEKLKGEIQGHPVSIIFNGTTHACEAMVILLHFIDDQWTIQQHVCRLKLLAKSMRGEKIAQQIVSIISQEPGIRSSFIIAASRDQAAVNDVAMRTVKVFYSSLDRVGSNSGFNGSVCYYLEGDGPLSLSAHECVRSLYAHISLRDFKNMLETGWRKFAA